MHVWRIRLGRAPRPVAGLLPLLSPEEIARAERIVVKEASRRFVVAHAATRMILGRYLGERAEDIRFVTGERGKPHVVTSSGAAELRFSLSHSGDLALCAVTHGRETGVDVEQVRPVSAWRDIAARYFSEQENRAMSSLDGAEAREAFLQGWTRKEAYSKALGEGLSQRWTEFTVSLRPGQAAGRVSAGPDAEVVGPLTLCALAPGAGYVAAVAVQGAGCRLSCWQWSYREPRPD